VTLLLPSRWRTFSPLRQRCWAQATIRRRRPLTHDMPALNPDELECDGPQPARAPLVVVEVGSRRNGPEDTPITRSAAIPTNTRRLEALARANQIRRARATLKRRIAAGELSAADVILTPPLEATSWPLGELLVSQRAWGRARSAKFLRSNRISEQKPLGELTERQRRLLAPQLAAHSRALDVDEALGPCSTALGEQARASVGSHAAT
jgi:hypothetical protein